MQLIRFTHPDTSFANDFEHLIRAMFRDNRHLASPPDGSTGPHVPTDFFEADDAFHASFVLPGLAKEDVKIELANSVLTVNGQLKNDHGEPAEGASFSRAISAPDGIELEKITAAMRDGILTITMPKAAEKNPNPISINVS